MTTAHSTAHFSVSLPGRNLDFVKSAVLVAVSLQYVYLFAFNYAPESVRTAFAGTLLCIHVALAALSLGQRPQTWQAAILLSIAMTICSWLVTHGINSDSTQFDTVEAVRDISIYVMPLWLLALPQAMPYRLLVVLAVCSTVVGGILAFTGPPVFVSGTPRLASFTGTVTQMHPSAKFIAVQLALIDQFRREGLLSRWAAWPTMLFALVTLVGYGGRNELLFVAVYFASLAYFRYRKDVVVRAFALAVVGFVVLGGVIALVLGSDIHSWGSGRIGTWHYRLGLIWSRDLVTFLFGGGVGADKMWTPQWWFFLEGTTAHNDFLHITVERGIVGLLATLLLFIGLLLALPGGSESVAIGIMVESFFTNGLFLTPLLAFNYFILASASVFSWHIQVASSQTDRLHQRG
jgi:hypothetical protein